MNEAGMRGVLVLCLVWLAVGGSGILSAQAPAMWGDLAPGPHAVGLRVAFVADSSRGFGSQPWRPIRVMIWYPAVRDPDAAPMRLGDLLTIDATDTAFAGYASAMRTRDSSTTARQFAAPADSLTDWITRLELAARRDAAPVSGRHPLVLHSLGLNDYQLENTILWEYLASRGYVVVVVPQVGPAPGQFGLTLSMADLGTQAGDLLVALRMAESLAFVASGSFAVVGHSAGALAGLLVLRDTPDAVGLVSLDGSVASPDGVRLLLESGLRFDGVRAPLLALYAVRQGGGIFDALDQMQNRQFRIGLGSGRPPTLATHFDFQSWPVFGVLSGIDDVRGASARPAAFGASVFQTTVRLTGYFLDLVLKQDSQAESVLLGREPVPAFPAALLTFGQNAGAAHQR